MSVENVFARFLHTSYNFTTDMIRTKSKLLEGMPLKEDSRGLFACSSVFTVSRRSGLFMFHTSGRFSQSRAVFSVMKTIATSLALIVTSVDYFLNDTTCYQESMKSSLGMEVIEVLSQVVSVHCHLIILVTRRARFEAFLHDFKNETARNINRSSINFGLLNVLMIFITYTILKYSTSPTTMSKAFLRVISYTLYCFLNFFVLLQFTTVLKLFQLKFLKLVKDLPGIVDIHQHAQLLRACEKVNKLYDWQLLLRVIHTFVNLLTHSSYFIGHLMTIEPSITHPWLLLSDFFFLFNIMFTVYELFHLAGCCKLTKEAADLFVTELFNMLRGSLELCSNVRKLYLNKDKLYLYVTAKPTINFTACGFFYLGYPLVTSIIAAAATYLVILVQFNFPK